MTSLHESVSRRRAAESADLSCVSSQPGSSALVIRQWQGASWVLPWSQFTSARLTNGEGSSQLELTFTTCQVVLTGSNLHGLVDDLAAFRIATVRDLPASYQPRPDDGSLFITRIEIRLTNREIRETPD